METYAQLKQNLKKLKLTCMYENIEQRHQEAIQGKMKYSDWLLLLTQDEIDRKNNMKIEALIKRSKIGKYNSILEFDFDFNPKINRQQILNFTTCDFISRNENIMITGPTGVGKTFIAKSIGIEACRRNMTVIFTRTAQMLDDICAGYADGTFKSKLKSYIKPKMLILDDWGLQIFSDKSLTILNEIISERYENGSIIITSNRPFKSWNELFNEQVIASALLDRLFNKTHKIIIEGKSYRRSL